MGLAILGIAFFHAPFQISNQWVKMFHDSLNCGVDLFLMLSGLGACHSIRSHGNLGYLRQRAIRLLPGLWLFLIPWCGVMRALGCMTGRELIGNFTMAGWWLGMDHQINWYFSAVWMFFLLAPALYALFCRTRHTVGLWLLLTAAGVAVGIWCPLDELKVAVARLPIFLIGMLLGRLEQTGFQKQRLLRIIAFAALPVGIWLVVLVNWGLGWWYGYSLGLWWYPYALVIPGAAILICDFAALLRSHRWGRGLMRPIEWCGEGSSEILMVHMGIYKIIWATTRFSNRSWALILVGSAVLGVAYHRGITAKLHFPARKNAES